jgi:hypothetical protein
MIIGIHGRKQCGKDTICKIIQLLDIYKGEGRKNDEIQFIKSRLTNSFYVNNHSIYEKHAFADNLKACASIVLGEPVEYFELEFFKNSFTAIPISNQEGEPMTNREFLQILGTEIGRNIDKDIWVKSLFREYNKDLDWIIPDVRFVNEAEAIKSRGGILIKVERDTGYTDNHASEHALDNYTNFDYVIQNNGTIEELISKVKEILLKERLYTNV